MRQAGRAKLKAPENDRRDIGLRRKYTRSALFPNTRRGHCACSSNRLSARSAVPTHSGRS